jgi:hypothetical protein
MTARLPASEEAFESGTEEVTSLPQSVLQHSQAFSPFAGRVMAASLFHRAFQHSTEIFTHNEPLDSRTNIYWKRHQQIDNDLVLLLQSLPEHLRLPRQIRCRNAVFVNIIIHMLIIVLHKATISAAASLTESEGKMRRSKERLTCAAEEILNIFRMLPDAREHLKNSILAFSVYLTSQVLLESSMPAEDDFFQLENLDFILRIMLLSSQTFDNPVSGSTSVQLATELRQRGLDSPAVEMVRRSVHQPETPAQLNRPGTRLGANVSFDPGIYER